MKSMKADFQYGNLSEVGRVRTENQDYYGRYYENFGQLIIVCDGMGGYTGGEIASRLAVESIYAHFKKLGGHYDPRYEIEQALLFAHKNILDHAQANPETQDMGTTVVLMLIIKTNFWFAVVGDSRLYLRRKGITKQLSKDHSFVQGMVDNGILTPEQAAEHPKRNVITKALGAKDAKPDISGPFSIYKSDVFMMCTDGLYNYFNTDELNNILANDPQEACNNLVELANQRGGEDNITVQIVKSNIGEKAPQPHEEKQKIPWIYVILLSTMLILLSLVYALNPNFKQRINNLWQRTKANTTAESTVVHPKQLGKPADNNIDIKIEGKGSSLNSSAGVNNTVGKPDTSKAKTKKDEK